MLKNWGLLFFLSLTIGHKPIAGSRFSKAQPERWITMSKPASEELLLWKWLQEKYYIDQNVYEEDIEFALPAGWICSLSADKNLFTVKNDQGLALFHLVESKDGSSKAFFLKKNFEILQSTFKN